ncbi:hypothetical protein ACMATS_23620 [Streptoverticillium reticulum]|uniref:hypothetical protein n=1 Tax=Streptoverticillium reticulum TaxID=1433415 RepID=UPI0039BF5FF9
MQNGNVVRTLGTVWLIGMATVALPGVALCGGTAFSDIVSSSTPLLASLAVATGLTAKRALRNSGVRASAQVAQA